MATEDRGRDPNLGPQSGPSGGGLTLRQSLRLLRTVVQGELSGSVGGAEGSVEERLFKEPYRFKFFQAVRILRLMFRRSQLDSAYGTNRLLRFRTPLSLEFPASEIQDIEKPADETIHEQEGLLPITMTVNFMGLTGPSGVLPRHYTETLIAARAHYRDSTAHQFFDLFNHRLIGLFAEAWEKYHFYIGYERGERGSFTRNLLDLVGLGTSQLQGRLKDSSGKGVYDHVFAYYGGLISQRPMSATALAAIVSDYFAVPAVVAQFRGRWLTLPQRELTVLGGANATLGDCATIGTCAWDHQSKFRVTLGPLKLNQLKDLLPGEKGHTALVRLVKLLAGTAFDCEVQLVVKKEEVPHCYLGNAERGGARLGLTSWLKTRDFDHDPRDIVLAT